MQMYVYFVNQWLFSTIQRWCLRILRVVLVRLLFPEVHVTFWHTYPLCTGDTMTPSLHVILWRLESSQSFASRYNQLLTSQSNQLPIRKTVLPVFYTSPTTRRRRRISLRWFVTNGAAFRRSGTWKTLEERRLPELCGRAPRRQSTLSWRRDVLMRGR